MEEPAPSRHMVFRLMLLGSPPDMVHGHPLRETGSSIITPRAASRAGVFPWDSITQLWGKYKGGTCYFFL